MVEPRSLAGSGIERTPRLHDPLIGSIMHNFGLIAADVDGRPTCEISRQLGHSPNIDAWAHTSTSAHASLTR
jgi:hypothetical protein